MRRIFTVGAALAGLLVFTLACRGETRADAGASPGGAAQQIWRELPQATPAGPGASSQGGAWPSPIVGFPSLAPLIKQLKPAVVNISTTTVTKNHPRTQRGFPGHGGPGPGGPSDEFFERFFGQPREMPEFRSNSLGSGFIISKDGFVLTNNHVAGDATEIKVKLADGREFPAKVVGKDALSDVALIKLEKAPQDLPTVALGDSDALEQGDFVLAMGNPFGLRDSASFGMVSAKARSIQASPFDDFIQTDAAINPGNSGGPLFNMRGEVVGINTAIVSPQIGQGIGFAVPITLVKQLLPQLEKGGKIARGYLGVTIGDLTADLGQAFGLPESVRGGAVVQDVVAGAPAAKAGVKPGDVVVAVNGKPVEDRSQLTRIVGSIAPGGKAALTLYRDGKKQEVTVTVAQRPDEEALARGETGGDGGEGGGEDASATGAATAARMGWKLQAVPPDVARQLKVSEGVVVADVSADGAAARAGLQRGDVILEVKGKGVARPDQVTAALGKARPGEAVLLRVKRGATTAFFPLRIPEAEAPGKK